MLNNFIDTSQYGVTMDADTQALKGAGGIASAIPYIGPVLGAMFNFWAQQNQNQVQEDFYNKYMSPAAKMAQMRAAGINPNAAAQGISGGSFAQMNAAAPTGAYSSLGEALGNSVNTALTAGNIAAQTRNLEVQTEGQDLMNKMTEVELGMKPDMLAAELDDLKESANQKRQAVEQSKTEIEKIKAEKEKLEQEKEYIIAEIGLVEYDKKVKEADASLKNAEAGLAKANKELADVNKEIQEKERDNYLTPAERIEKEAKEKVKAEFDNSPQGRIKKMYLEQMEKELAPLRWQLEQLEKNHGSGVAKRSVQKKMQRVIREYRNKMRRVDRGFAAGANFAGYGLNAGG